MPSSVRYVPQIFGGAARMRAAVIGGPRIILNGGASWRWRATWRSRSGYFGGQVMGAIQPPGELPGTGPGVQGMAPGVL